MQFFLNIKKHKTAIFIGFLFLVILILSIHLFKSGNGCENKKVNFKTMKTSAFTKILDTDDGINAISVWRPNSKDDYRPLGDTSSPDQTEAPSDQVVLVSGDVTPPENYKLVFQNTDKNVYSWMPIPKDGYVCLGDVITNKDEKPDTDLIRCVPYKVTKLKRGLNTTTVYQSNSGSLMKGYENQLISNNNKKENLRPIYELNNSK